MISDKSFPTDRCWLPGHHPTGFWHHSETSLFPKKICKPHPEGSLLPNRSFFCTPVLFQLGDHRKRGGIFISRKNIPSSVGNTRAKPLSRCKFLGEDFPWAPIKGAERVKRRKDGRNWLRFPWQLLTHSISAPSSGKMSLSCCRLITIFAGS